MVKKGDIVKGKITGIKEYGAFAKVEGYDGLIHISEFSDNYVKDIKSFVKVGEVVKLTILDVDEFDSKLKLSYKSANRINDKVLRYTKIKIGYRPLGEKMDEWLDVGYQQVLDFKKRSNKK